jgi:endonuclease I
LDSKIGLDHRGEEVVQARPEIRGDIARTILYMALKWERPLASTQELKVL